MIPSQIVTGSANPSPSTFSYTKIDQEIYYAYSSGNNVQILKGASLKVIQILSGHRSEVTCVSWMTDDSKLLTSSGTEIFLYILNNENGKFAWNRVFILKNPFEINSMSWLTPNTFIVGGAYLAKWKIDMEKIMKVYKMSEKLRGADLVSGQENYASPMGGMSKVREQKMIDKQAKITWTIDSSQPIHYLSCSPDGSLFATASKYDRMIKIWYLQKKHAKKSKLDSDLEELERQQQQQLQAQQLRAQVIQQKGGYYREEFNRLTNKNTYVQSSTNYFNREKERDKDREGDYTSPSVNSTTSGGEVERTNEYMQQHELKIKKKSQQKQKKFELESYGFIYLAHPRSITWISWRHRKTASHNILLTSCKDGIVRLWQQSYQSRRLQFNVSNIIQSGSDIIDWVSNFNEEDLDAILHAPSKDKEVDSNGSSIKDTSKELASLRNPILQRQKSSLVKNKLIVDWIIGIKMDGSLFLWKLRTDTSLSKQTSSISIWINNQILSNQEIGPNRIIALYQPISLTDNTPSSIKICFNSFNGAITCRKFFIQHQNHTQISNSSLNSRCYGHKGLIRNISVSPTSPYLSSTDQQNNVILWQANDTSLIQSPYFITDIGSFPNFFSSVWSPSKRYCFFSNREGIIVYHVESIDHTMNSLVNHTNTTLPSSHTSMKTLPIYIGLIKESRLENDWLEEIQIVEPLSSIYTNDPKRTNRVLIPYEFFVVAMNKDGNKIMVWGISIRKDSQYSPSGTTNVLKTRLLATKEFERYSRVTCMCAAPKGISDGVEQPDFSAAMLSSDPMESVLPTQPLIVTGTIEGFISVLGLSAKIKTDTSTPKPQLDEMEFIAQEENDPELPLDKYDWEITEMASHGAYSQPVESVKPAYYGRFATKAISTLNPNAEIHIWELESHTPSLRLEDTIRILADEEDRSKSGPVAISLSQDTVQITSGSGGCCYSFATSDDGNDFLAVGFGNAIQILAKPVDRSIGSYKMPWIETHHYTDLTMPCRSIEWGKDMSLFATSGNQILVFSKWMKPSMITDDSSLSAKLLQRSHEIQSLYHQQSELSRSLPFYHPKFFTEYMMAGKFDTIELLLSHIFKFLLNLYNENNQFEDGLPTKPIYIPPLADEILHSKFNAQSTLKANQSGNSDDMDNINNYSKKDSDDEEDEEDYFSDSKSGKFTKRQGVKLNEILSMIKLANLTSSEQIQLLAVTDTYGEIGEMRGGLDENGSRFLLVTKIFQFLIRSLSPIDRPISLSTNDILWALHSEAQETILQVSFPTDPDWDDLKQIGAGLWIKSPSTLRNVIEKLAKTTYTKTKDPGECSLYYLALKKKGALIALHKANKNIKQVDFLSQDFTQQKWVTAALKSAFLLQSKHKYEIAASLFLLAGQLKQAVNLILQILGDFQLALVISRLYEGENGEVGRMVIEEHIIPHAKKTGDRSLLSIGNWLLKKYEDAFTILLPSTVIELNKKLDDISKDNYLNVASPIPSGSTSPSVHGSSIRSSTTTSPKPIGYNSNVISIPQQITAQKAIFSQLRSSDMGPSLLYFFRFLKNHTLLRQIPDSMKNDDQILRNSAYSYLNSGCTVLALDNIRELEKVHPKLASQGDIKKLKDEFDLKQKEKEEKEKEKTSSKSNDMGLDFGGSSSSSSYFNSSSNNDMGLDFGGGSSNKQSSSYFGSSSNYDMGLDFGGSSNKQSSSFFGSNNDTGLDFGGSSSSSSYFNSSSNNDMGLDFGGSSNKQSSSYFGSNNDMGLDFGSTTTTKPSNSWDFLDSSHSTETPSITTTDTSEKTTDATTTDATPKSEFKYNNENDKNSFYPIIDTELKLKSILSILVDRILVYRSQKHHQPKQTIDEMIQDYQELETNIKFYSQEYQIDEKQIFESLSQICLDRQYLKETVHLLHSIKKNTSEIMDQVCISIVKSVARMDDYRSSTDFKLLQTLIIELYQAHQLYLAYSSTDAVIAAANHTGSPVGQHRAQFHHHQSEQLFTITILIMILLLGCGNNRYDVILKLFDSKPFNLQSVMEKFTTLPVTHYVDQPTEDAIEEDEDDDDLDEKAKQSILTSLGYLFDYLIIKKFRFNYDEFIKQSTTTTINIHHLHILDIINQRLNYWIGTIQLKLLIMPKQIIEHYSKKPPRFTSPTDHLFDYIKSFKLYNTRDIQEVWNMLLFKVEQSDVLDKIILGEDIAMALNSSITSTAEIVIRNTTSGSGTGKLKFEDEIELFKDGDLLQSFCLDKTSSDLSVIAIATTRGIRELNLKQLYEYYRDDFDVDTFSVTDNFLSPTPSKKSSFKISTKTLQNLSLSGSGAGLPLSGGNIANQHLSISPNSLTTNTNVSGMSGPIQPKNKQNVFKSAISSLSKHVDHNIVVQCLESHPTSSYYLSGGIDGSVCLWQYGIPEVLTAYQLPSKPRIVKTHFNRSGTKFGACDMAGNILLWQFAAQEDTLKPFYSLQAHSKQTLDFTFLNSGSLLATAGISTDSKKDVCIWDVLLPPHKALISSFSDQEGGGSSIVYSPKHQCIVVGGKKGAISLYDIRMNKVMDSFKAHQLNTKTLAMDPNEEFIVSGSSDGNIKVWSLPSLTCMQTFEDAHKKQTFVRPVGVFKSPVSTYGVMQVDIENNHIYSCGADGRLSKRKIIK